MAVEKKQGYDIVIALTTSSKGRNYEVGIIKLCHNKSFIVLLSKT